MTRRDVLVIAIGCTIGILIVLTVNVLLTPTYLWFLYPTFFFILWPVSLFLIQRKKYTLYAYFCSSLLIFDIVLENILNSPEHPWFLYAVYPLIWWPITVSIGKKAKSIPFAWLVAITTILYYSLLNIVFSPVHPWAIYPSFLVLWWPITLYFIRKKNYFGFSVAGSALSILFFGVLNVVTTPQTPWAIFPIFVLLWWPLSMYYFGFLKQRLLKPKRNPEH